MAVFMLNIPTEQKIQIKDGRNIHCLAYSHPAYYGRRKLAVDFGRVAVKDRLLLCSGSELKSVATVDVIEDAIDYTDRPVRILRGPVVARFGRVSVGAAMKRAEQTGFAPPPLINSARTGFKEQAFCAEVPDPLYDDLLETWLSAAQRARLSEWSQSDGKSD